MDNWMTITRDMCLHSREPTRCNTFGRDAEDSTPIDTCASSWKIHHRQAPLSAYAKLACVWVLLLGAGTWDSLPVLC